MPNLPILFDLGGGKGRWNTITTCMTWLAPFHHHVVWLSKGLNLKNFITLSRIYESRGIIVEYPRGSKGGKAPTSYFHLEKHSYYKPWRTKWI
jgi:hypothetical protein